MLSCHIAIEPSGIHDTVLQEAQKILHDDFGIEHSTLQVENKQNGCPNPHQSCN